MSVDEIETYFYCEHDRQQTWGESQFAAKLHTNRQINRDKKFSSFRNRNMISTFIKKLIFTNEIDCHFDDRCETN